MLLPPDFEDAGGEIPPPLYLTVPGEGVRLHLKAKQLGDVVRKSLFDQKKKGGGMGGAWGSLVESAVTALGTEVAAVETEEGGESGTRKKPAAPITKFPLGGKSDRVDFSLQTAVIDSEYISAVTAHSGYFANEDLLNFLIGILAESEAEVSKQ